jgi:beta-galactosidase
MRKLFISLFLCASASFARQLVVNASFSDENGNPSLKGWRHSGGVIAAKDEDGKNKLVVCGENLSAGQSLKLLPSDGKLQLRMWMKVTDVQLGRDSWRTGRLAMTFQDESHKMVGAWPNVFGMVGSSDWTLCERIYSIPKGAAYLDFSASNFGSSGCVEFKDITFTIIADRVTAPVDAACPPEAGDAMSIADAWRQQSPTREKICLNGLWQFRPVLSSDNEEQVPAVGDSWGWFRIPGIWPNGRWTDSSNQNPILSPYLEDELSAEELLSSQAWYQRRISVPGDWQNRNIAIDFTLLNTYAKIFVDGKAAGELWFPGGELDLSAWLKPGQEQSIALLVKGIPLDQERLDFMAPDRIIASKATLKFKGVTGDVFLHARPSTQRLEHVAIVPSVRKGSISFQADLNQHDERQYILAAEIFDAQQRLLKSFRSAPLRAGDAKSIAFSEAWPDAPRWDTDSPTLLSAHISLSSSDGQLIDQFTPVSFGFREFWIEGRDLLLNGSVIRLRALHNISSNTHASAAAKEGVLNTIERMRSYGFNFLITGNYNFRAGDMSYIDGLLEGCQETGMLMSFSLPHVNQFNWKLHEPEIRERYTAMTRWLIRRVQNNPAVVMYAMNHNATGYYGDQNPLKIDGVYQPEPAELNWSKLQPDKGFERWARRVQAKHSEQIAKSLDPTRPIYHHQSGNLGDVYTLNIYLNWSPLQERSDWLEHWSSKGTKPLFFVEWGLPHISTWSSYRGPAFIWRSAAFQRLWAAEFAAAELGNDAYRQAMAGSAAIDREEALWGTGEPFLWSGLCHSVTNYPFYVPIMAKYAQDNWRSHRAAGISAMLPWDQETLWRRKPRTSTSITNPNAYQGLKNPGIVYEGTGGHSYLYDRGDVNDYGPSELGETFLRYNQPLCAYIGGKADEPTDKTSVYAPGEKAVKSIVLINDSRGERRCDYQWSFAEQNEQGSVQLAIGEIKLIPLNLNMPQVNAHSSFQLLFNCSFDNGVSFKDDLNLRVQAPLPPLQLRARPQLFDPVGKTTAWLRRIGLSEFETLSADARPDFGRMIIIGREALSDAPPLPWLGEAVRSGRVLVFEQTQEVLSERLGFRTNIHGLRELFVRVADHPAIRALGRSPDSLFQYWRGHSSMTTPFLEELPHLETGDPRWNWHDFRNTRVWRAGNRNNVASVLIEKPSIGNWTALIDGGFDLQYAPLLECELEQGRSIFCQLDVSARSEDDLSANQLGQALLGYLDQAPPPATPRRTYYAGNEQGRELLQGLGVVFTAYNDQPLDASSLLILGPEAFVSREQDAAALVGLVNQGCNVLALGLNAAELASIAPELVAEDEFQDYAQTLPSAIAPALRGVSAAETYWHTKLTFTALRLGDFDYATHALLAMPFGAGQAACQQAPPWLFDYAAKPYLRTSYRRSLYLTARLLANLGAAAHNPLPKLIATPFTQRNLELTDGWIGIEDRKNIGREQGWFKSDSDSSAWPPIEVPGNFDVQRSELADYDGHFWYRKRFQVPAHFKLNDVELYIGPVDDESWVWLNDHFLGEVTKDSQPENYWSFPRRYTLAPGMLKTDGDNVLTILVNDIYLKGGILGKPALLTRGSWLRSYYLQVPEAVDDPYRYYRW